MPGGTMSEKLKDLYNE